MPDLLDWTNLMALMRSLGLRANPALDTAKPAFDKAETKTFREKQRKPHMRRAVVAFVLVFAITYVATRYASGALLTALTVCNVIAVLTLMWSTLFNLLIRTGNWTLRQNPWVTCKAEVRPVLLGGRPVLYLIRAKHQGWNDSVLCAIRRKYADEIQPDKKGVMLVAGELGGPMAFAPRSGAPVALARRAWPASLRRLLWERAGGSAAKP